MHHDGWGKRMAKCWCCVTRVIAKYLCTGTLLVYRKGLMRHLARRGLKEGKNNQWPFPALGTWHFNSGCIQLSGLIHIPANFFWVKGVRFLSCRLSGFPKMIQLFLKISWNFWGCSEEFLSSEVLWCIWDRMKENNLLSFFPSKSVDLG